MASRALSRVRGRGGPALPLVALLAGVAWLALLAWGLSPAARYMRHDEFGGSAGPVVVLVFLGGWLLMTTAMMLPTTLPLASMVRRITVQRADSARCMAALVSGYLGVWLLAGIAVALGDTALHRLVDAVPFVDRRPWIVASAVLLGAAAYELSPMKYRCLDACRQPMSFVLRRWTGSDAAGQSLRIGVEHGAFCVACCWSLMLVCVALGAGNVGWMLAFGAVMAAEKNAVMGRRMVQPVAMLLGLAGVLLAAVHVVG